MQAAVAAPAPLSEEAGAVLRRLRWRTRRGLLENDLLLGRLLDRHAQSFGPEALAALALLLALPDGELLDLALGRSELDADLDQPAVREMLGLLRDV